jgi:hypothetical protein
MKPEQLDHLAGAVQHNCDISDARHGADYSLCVYLMKMREYYRWEQRLPFGAALPKDAVGDWLQARERLWEELEDAEMQPLDIDGRAYDPFDADAINAALADHGLVYSGGLGSRAKPHFFLGKLDRQARNGGYSVYVSASEYARDLAAPPAMTRGNSIFLRRESLSRMLWEKLESWRWSRPDNALGRAFACYDFDADLEGSLQAMTDREIDNALLHEQGEYEAGQRLGDTDWNAMLMDLADCLVTLPRITEPESLDEPALHFYLGNLTHMRKAIFPALLTAYEDWREDGDAGRLREAAKTGREHWLQLGSEMIELHRRRGPDAAASIRDLVDRHHL